MERKHKEFLFLLHHVDPNSSLTTLVPGSRNIQQLWQTQVNTDNLLQLKIINIIITWQENEDKKHNEEEFVGDINSDMNASGEQQQLLLQQLSAWPDTQHSSHSSPSHSENLLVDSPR